MYSPLVVVANGRKLNMKIPKKLSESAKNRFAAKQYIRDFKENHPCVDCGEEDIRVLEFDHKDRKTKISSVSEMANLGASLETVMLEIEKCEIRCCNCHRIKTVTEPFYSRKNVIPEHLKAEAEEIGKAFSFYNFMKGKKVTNTPEGDFVEDYNLDEEIWERNSLDSLERRLIACYACEGAFNTLKRWWGRYEKARTVFVLTKLGMEKSQRQFLKADRSLA